VRSAARAEALHIGFVGDVLLGAVAQPLLELHGYAFPFAHTAPLLAGCDLLVGNLEGPITANDVPLDASKPARFRAHPRAAAALREAGFDVLCLANNHILDFGELGLADTQRALSDAGLGGFGAGASASEALAGRVVELAGVRIGFLAFMERWPVYAERWRWFAEDGHGGVAPMAKPALEHALAALRPRVDVLVACFHWGGDRVAETTRKQRRFGRLAVKLGADLVVGHHPHVAQGVELYRGAPILYSLGNFTYGGAARFDAVDPVLRHGWLADVTLAHARVARVELLPIAVDEREVGFQPHAAHPGVLPALVELVQRGLAAPLEIAGTGAVLIP
jgi:poly-gamma-glutamate synthesis protein (capsule biosynthesis protein)